MVPPSSSTPFQLAQLVDDAIRSGRVAFGGVGLRQTADVAANSITMVRMPRHMPKYGVRLSPRAHNGWR